MQQGIKINQFVLGGCGIIVILTAIASSVSKGTNDSLIASSNSLLLTHSVKTQLKEIEKNLIDAETGQRGFILTKKEEYLEPYRTATNRLRNAYLELESKISDRAAQKTIINEIEALSQQKLNELEETINLKKANREQEALNLILSDRGKKIMDAIRQKLDELTRLENQEIENQQKQATQVQTFADFVILLTFICIVSTVVVVSLATILIPSRALSLSLQNAFTLAEKVSQGDLTSQVEVSSNNVIGKLMTVLKNMTQSLNSLVRQVQQSAVQVTTSATQIAAFGKQLEATMTEQVASTNEVAVTAKEIAVTSRELVKTMEEVALMSQGTTTAANSSQKDLLRMEATMRQLGEATHIIASRLGVISEKANNINNIVVTITKVADQTNLLSLNAAIEAEKAGEYGLGFAVVAREIRRLADQTAVATLEIEKMVKQMQSSVSAGVMEMDKFAKEVGQSVADVANISGQMSHIIEQVQELTPRFDAVNSGMEAQSQGAQQISDAMVQLSNTSIQTTDSLQEINNAIAQLNHVAWGLHQEMTRFKVKTDNVAM
ncbi:MULTISPECIES: methyl-accepting chemotaxis protein [Nostocales]|uniref:Chemotaxis protein n=3 Tax=Nostocales TaxID=1161 RepID=A0A0C1RG85_9CYAN|nr:CHASE3 domain-containing protein [Tolypothrix bouteillei]KAF3887212.1 methyl-accepting chemotaxis protein [Tolypothrix bouteillei VB521301]